MKRAGGGFDASYNAQTAVDAHRHIIVAAELTHCGSDAGELPGMLQAVQDNLGALPAQALADTGYKAEAVFEMLAGCGCDLIFARALHVFGEIQALERLLDTPNDEIGLALMDERLPKRVRSKSGVASGAL